MGCQISEGNILGIKKNCAQFIVLQFFCVFKSTQSFSCVIMSCLFLVYTRGASFPFHNGITSFRFGIRFVCAGPSSCHLIFEMMILVRIRQHKLRKMPEFLQKIEPK